MVYSCFRRLIQSGVWDEVVDVLRVDSRYSQGYNALPKAAMLDSQGVKITEKGGSWLRLRQEDQRAQTLHAV
jgi:putative transposase